MAYYPASIDLDDPADPRVGGIHIVDAGAGNRVSMVGDVNGDGFDDMLVSVDVAQSYEADFSNYIVFGTDEGIDPAFSLADIDGSNGFKIEARAGWESSAAIGAGDLNGDGLADLAFVTSDRVAGQYAHADVQVILGSTADTDGSISLDDLDGSNGFSLIGPTDVRTTYYDLTAAGDVNGDGLDELMIGTNSTIGFLFGDEAFAAEAEVADVAPTDIYRYLGDSIGIGDVNDDGYDDMVIGSVLHYGRMPGEDANPFHGPFKDHVTWITTPSTAYGNSSGGVAAAGDVNGDGIDDFIISRAYTAPHGHTQGGEAWVVFGKQGVLPSSLVVSDLDGSNGFAIRGEHWSRLGTYVSGAGDINGDGYDDVVVTEEKGDSAYVIFGRGDFHTPGFDVEDLDGKNGFRITNPGTEFLASVSGIGDFNGDGFDDIAFGERPYGIDSESDAHIVWGQKPTEAVTRVDRGGDQTVHGGLGNDLLISYGGDDHLIGDAGNDTLRSLSGADILEGGKGDDSYWVFADTTDSIVDSGGIDTIRTTRSWDLRNNPTIENVELSAFGDWSVTGNELDNKLTGAGGDDVLRGLDGNDRIDGGFGKDVLVGGEGRDILSGGRGDDRFTFGDGDVGVGAARDVILDYGDYDQISVGLIDADTTRYSNQAFTFIRDREFTGTAGELRFESQTDGNGDVVTLVEGDQTGDGVADFQLELRGQHMLYEGDFIL